MMLVLRAFLSGLLCFFIFTLSACGKSKSTYSYLMLHPEYLQQAYSQCLEELSSSSVLCETVKRAQLDFIALTNQRQEDPERFGGRIMQEEEESALLKSRFEEATRIYRQASLSQSSPDELKKLHMELEKAKSEYKRSVERVNILLAVVAATSTI